MLNEAKKLATLEPETQSEFSLNHRISFRFGFKIPSGFGMNRNCFSFWIKAHHFFFFFFFSLLFHCSFSIYLWKLNRFFFFSCVFIYSDFNQFEIVRFVNYHNSFFSNNKTVKKIKSNFRFFLQLFTKNNKCLFTFLLIIMTKLM